ncbi:MAG: hypothetical protein LBV38_01875 [Alistipes sp.]|jgi:hypothetical protein|nr:hypothetical protein [Alistipes sp.]
MRKILILAAATVTALAALTLASCDKSYSGSGDLNSGGGSQGGSMARFTLVGDYLYTVDSYNLNVVSVADPRKPVDIDRMYVGGQIETIFAKDDVLFMGSQGAMYIYDISRPEFPKYRSATSHLRSCDPVVAADTLAFVTLNNSLGNWCGARGDMLQVYDISDVENPELIEEVNMSSPRGLAVDIESKIVFVCDNGIKAYDITDPRNVEGLFTAGSLPEVGRIDAYDCIVTDGRLLVIGSDGLYQLGYDREKFTFISKIDLRREQP